MTIMCYKLKEPIVYNKGTSWEKTQDKFLAYETYKGIEEAKAEAKRYNDTKPNVDALGNPIDWNKIDYFYAYTTQEAM